MPRNPVASRSLLLAAAFVSALAMSGCKRATPAPVATGSRMEWSVRLDQAALTAELEPALRAAGVIPEGAKARVSLVVQSGRGYARIDGAIVSWTQAGTEVQTRLSADQAWQRLRLRLIARGAVPADAAGLLADFASTGSGPALVIRWTTTAGEAPAEATGR